MIRELNTAEAPVAEVVSLLKRRADAARQNQDSGEEEATVWVGSFSVGDETFAIPLASLRAAMSLRLVTPVPLSSPEVIGIVRYQGEVLTVFSLASLLGVRGWREDPMMLIIVELSPGHRIALDCEQIPKAIALPLAALSAAQKSSADAHVEVMTSESTTVSVIDVARLLARRRGGK